MRLLEVTALVRGTAPSAMAAGARKQLHKLVAAGRVAMAAVALAAKEAHDGGALRMDDDTAEPAGHAG